jgi:hypothetical protein
MYALTITFADHKNNAFVELGGAAWKTRKEQLEQWRLIPGVSDTGIHLFFTPKGNVFRSPFTRPNLNFSTWVTPSDQCSTRNCREEPSKFWILPRHWAR